MAITVAAGVLDRLQSEAGLTARLHVLGAADRVPAAVRAAIPDIARLASPAAPVVVMGPFPVPDGCLFLVDFEAATPPAARERVPGILVRQLTAAGITDAEIHLADQLGSRYDRVRSYRPVARAWLVGPQPEPGTGVFPVPDPAVVDAALRWIGERGQPRVVVVDMDVPVAPETLPGVITGMHRAGEYQVSVVATDFTTTAASVVFGEFFGTGVTLSTAAANWPAATLAGQLRAQREIVRACAGSAGLVWGGVTAEASNRDLLTGDQNRPDHHLIGPVWYQVLSPEQLAGIGHAPAGAVELPGGRIELTVGEPEQWLPGHPDRIAVQRQASSLVPW